MMVLNDGGGDGDDNDDDDDDGHLNTDLTTAAAQRFILYLFTAR